MPQATSFASLGRTLIEEALSHTRATLGFDESIGPGGVMKKAGFLIFQPRKNFFARSLLQLLVQQGLAMPSGCARGTRYISTVKTSSSSFSLCEQGVRIIENMKRHIFYFLLSHGPSSRRQIETLAGMEVSLENGKHLGWVCWLLLNELKREGKVVETGRVWHLPNQVVE